MGYSPIITLEQTGSVRRSRSMRKMAATTCSIVSSPAHVPTGKLKENTSATPDDRQSTCLKCRDIISPLTVLFRTTTTHERIPNRRFQVYHILWVTTTPSKPAPSRNIWRKENGRSKFRWGGGLLRPYLDLPLILFSEMYHCCKLVCWMIRPTE